MRRRTFGRAMPMMMTAAGTIAPARVLIMGVGVAGLQAIATARRLGAIVSATDVRPATKEQVESLGATFVAVIDDEFKQAETAAGYAKEMSKEYQAKQAALIAETIKKQDIVITTALIPGRKAPVLVTEEMVKTMKPGSVIVDLAVEAGRQLPAVEARQVVETSMASPSWATPICPRAWPVDTSSLYARNLFNFVSLIVDKKTGRSRSTGTTRSSKAPASRATARSCIQRSKDRTMEAIDPFVFRLSIFVLAIFVGYFVVWSVTPALHTPLMSVTNAISSVIVVGALIALSVAAASAL